MSEQDEALATVRTQLAELSNLMEPGISGWMMRLNTNLRQFPDLPHLLTDEEIKPYYDLIASQTKVQIAKPPKVPKPRGKSKLSVKIEDMFHGI